MRIAEALIQRKELVKKMNRLNEEISSVLITEEASTPDENFISSRIEKIITLSNELAELNLKINVANSKNLANELNELKTLDSLISFHQKWRKALLNPKDEFIYSRGEKTYKANFSIDKMNTSLEDLEEMRRNVDRFLQRKNWEIDI